MKIVLLAATIAGLLAAQAPAPLSYVNEIKQSYTGIKNNVLRSAEKMPEDKYTFKPSPNMPETRDFAGEVAHAADIQTMLCSMALNAPKQGTAATKKTKAELIAALQESNTLCDQAYASVTDANANEARPFIRGQRTLIGVLEFNVAHHNETYGTMVPYLRMNNLVPPTSDNAGNAAKGKAK
ncbi:MAG: DinB family protein [Acidobacteriota bacterium]